MYRRRGGGRFFSLIIGLIICLWLIPILGWALNLIVMLGAAAFGAMLIAMVVSAIKGNAQRQEAPKAKPADVSVKGQSTAESKNNAANVAVPAQNLPDLTPEQRAIIKSANTHINDSRFAVNRIRDNDVRAASDKALRQAEQVIKVLREQPDDIRTCHQFLNYYLPTLEVVIKKFATLEGSGVDISQTREHMLSYLSDIGKAMDKQYTNLFENEKLDLSVEMEAMQNAFKRDGLITETEIPVSAETEVKLTI